MTFVNRQLVASAAVALLGSAAVSVAQGLSTLDAGGGLYLNQVGGRALVREPSGEASELALPRGTAMRRIEPLAEGWIAAGEIEVPEGSDLYLVRSDGGVRSPLPAPPNASGTALRAGPMPLVEGGRLAGLAWLAGEGVRRTAVYASAWSGLDWSPPELVSPAGPGTQIAIDGAVLADGSWLLVWAANDGDDDEILWSRRAGGRWSTPAVLHAPNEVPDGTPALVATGRGALAAWNGYDGRTYRVRLAGFEDGVWRDLGFAGPAGAVSPGLTPDDGGALLLYRTVTPSTWVLQQLDERGTILRTAALERETTSRPGLVPVDGPATGLEWPGEQIAVPLRIDVGWRAER